MATVELNTQQVLNMGSQVEKLQHRLQHLPTTTADQLEAERANLDEKKRLEVQDVDQSNEGHPVNPDSKGQGQRERKDETEDETDAGTEAEIQAKSETPKAEGSCSPEIVKEQPYHGRQINLIV